MGPVRIASSAAGAAGYECLPAHGKIRGAQQATFGRGFRQREEGAGLSPQGAGQRGGLTGRHGVEGGSRQRGGKRLGGAGR
jgi:hypothetical protein